MRIIFVHGVGTYDKDYFRQWAEPLGKALSKLGVPQRMYSFDGVLYADLMYHLPQNEMFEGVKSAAVHDLWATAVKEASFAFPFRELAHSVMESFSEIFTYFYYPGTFEAVNQRVADTASGRTPVTLIGYSLGSLVSLCALHASRMKVAHLMLVASPLFWFKREMNKKIDLAQPLPARVTTNIAGITDIAWPQKVPGLLPKLTEHVDFFLDHNPIKGHSNYFTSERAIDAMAAAIKKNI